MYFFDLLGVCAYTHGRPISAMVGAGAFRPSVMTGFRFGCHVLFDDFFIQYINRLLRRLRTGARAPTRLAKAGADSELSATLKEENVLADFGKKLILGLIAAACVVGVHAAMIASVAG